MARRERDVLERAVHAVAEQAAKTNVVIDEAMDAGIAADHPGIVAAKQVRLELLNVKADLERELGQSGPQLQGLRSGGPLGTGSQHG